MIPVFDFQQKKRVGSKAIKSATSGVVSKYKIGYILNYDFLGLNFLIHFLGNS